ncbi:hypothetical protein D9758_010380 [Tetrapyrgos nigripes]|uniref:R3H domain-containing protein n=1 Tax=Tetrapyrgos nigripes TaxID=182062 RepID=A0A8H5FVM8_9AGAR|nr:hypothetical protein D9758_010380 [Tetrapyrgos nigripes]
MRDHAVAETITPFHAIARHPTSFHHYPPPQSKAAPPPNLLSVHALTPIIQDPLHAEANTALADNSYEPSKEGNQDRDRRIDQWIDKDACGVDIDALSAAVQSETQNHPYPVELKANAITSAVSLRHLVDTAKHHIHAKQTMSVFHYVICWRGRRLGVGLLVGSFLDVDSIATIGYATQTIEGLVPPCLECHFSFSLPDQHPSTDLCHAPAVYPEDEPYQSLVSLACPCRRILQAILCSKSTSNPSGSSKTKSLQEPKCTTECAVEKRVKKLAETLGINTARCCSSNGNGNGGSGSGRSGLREGMVYTGELVAFGRGNGKFLAVVEKAFAEFVTLLKISQVLPHMPPDRRKFVHDLVNEYRMGTKW